MVSTMKKTCPKCLAECKRAGNFFYSVKLLDLVNKKAFKLKSTIFGFKSSEATEPTGNVPSLM